MNENEAPGLPEAIGHRIRDLRREKATAEDVAAWAQAFGLGWYRSTVARLETGARGLSASELLLLPAILTAATGQAVTLEGLLAGVRAALTPSFVLGGGALDHREATGEKVVLVIDVDSLLFDMGALLDGEGVVFEVVGGGIVAPRDAEHRAARSLGISVAEVLELADALWGQTLSEQRDDKVIGRVGPDASARTVQALRGHVTRELIEELAELEGDDDG